MCSHVAVLCDHMLPYATVVRLKKLEKPYAAIYYHVSIISLRKLASPYAIIRRHMHPYTIICDGN